VYAGTADGWLGSVDAAGALRWQVQAGAPIERSPVLGENGDIYAAAGQELVALSGGGALRWRLPAGGRVVGGPLVADDGTVFVAVLEKGGRGAALGVDGEGRLRTRLPLPAAPASSLSLAGHRLWVGLRDGTVRRLAVTQEGLARSSWAKARGDLTNSGAVRHQGPDR
jgi:outer membrane protein assembly factor BamB